MKTYFRVKAHNRANKFILFWIIFALLFARAFQEYFATYSDVFSAELIESVNVLLLTVFFSLFLFLFFYGFSLKFRYSNQLLILVLVIPGILFNNNLFIYVFIFILWSLVKTYINTKQYILIMFTIYLLINISIIVLYCFGTSHVIYEMRFGMIETYGLNHQNSFPIYIFLFSLTFVLVFHEKKWLCILYLIVVFYIGVIIFTSRSLHVGLLLILFFYIISYFKTYKLFCLIPFALLLCSLYITLNIEKNPYFEALNLLSSNRFSYSFIMLSELKNTIAWLFGNNITEPRLPLDNSYIAMIYKFGLIPTIIYLYLLTKVLYQLILEQRNLLVCMICVLCIYSSLENILPRTIFNFVLFFMVSPLFVANKSRNIAIPPSRSIN